MNYDAIVVISFGGPEGMQDVMPYLDNVLRGRNVPRERQEEVARHYARFNGVSPINGQNRRLIEALQVELAGHDLDLPVYFGNRNWHPLLTDTIRAMARDGVHRALAFVTSAYSSYSGCRQYLEDIGRAREEVGPTAPWIDKIRVFYNHPEFIAANADFAARARGQLPAPLQSGVPVVFTAHSLPASMALNCDYEEQLKETCRLVADAAGFAVWTLAFQSRSGLPHQPWLEPDVCDVLRDVKAGGADAVVVAPVGFLSDHIEVLFDLDIEAREVAEETGLTMVRSPTVGAHPRFVAMVRELIEERQADQPERKAIGTRGAYPDRCPEGCCLSGPSRGSQFRTS